MSRARKRTDGSQCLVAGAEEIRNAGPLCGSIRPRKAELAEMQRLKGEILLMRNGSAIGEAEGCFRSAIKLARVQAAKWWELRATVSLARLLAQQGRSEEARVMLAEIYSWFTEGFDTADLKDARALLDELSRY